MASVRILPLVTSGAMIGALLMACRSEPERQGEGADTADINAGNASKGYAAVGVVHQSVVQSFCTGTLVAPDVVLTAGHCIEGDEKIDAFYTGNGKATPDDSVDPATLGMVRHAVAEQMRFPTFEYFYTCPNPALDVALLRLEKPITDIAPVKLGGPPKTGDVCTAVGFGSHELDGGEQTFLEKRAAKVTVATVRESSLDVSAVTGIASHGDSGGPLLCGGALVATTSCQPDYPMDVIAYGNVALGLPWIRSMIARWDPRTTEDGGAPGP